MESLLKTKNKVVISCSNLTFGYAAAAAKSLQSCLTISSLAARFSFCLQSFPASGSFLVIQLVTPGGQSIGASVSVSVLPVNIQG